MWAWIAKNRVLWLLIVFVIGFGLDQASKIWAQENLSKKVPVSAATDTGFVDKHIPTSPYVVIPGYFQFRYAENPAAAFSFMHSIPENFRRPFLLTVSSLASIFFLIWYLRMKEQDGLFLNSLAFVLAGAAGNLADRIRLSYVIDFIDFYWSSEPISSFLIRTVSTNHWPTFNIADMCVVAGAIGVIWRTFKPYQDEIKELIEKKDLSKVEPKVESEKVIGTLSVL